MSPLAYVLLLYAVGAVARVVLPYLRKWVDNPDMKFDVRYVVGQLLAVVVALLPVIFTDSFREAAAEMSLWASFSFGWAAADIGREFQGWVAKK